MLAILGSRRRSVVYLYGMWGTDKLHGLTEMVFMTLSRKVELVSPNDTSFAEFQPTDVLSLSLKERIERANVCLNRSKKLLQLSNDILARVRMEVV